MTAKPDIPIPIGVVTTRAARALRAYILPDDIDAALQGTTPTNAVRREVLLVLSRRTAWKARESRACAWLAAEGRGID